MPKLSPHYREDDTGNLPDNIKKYLDQHYLKHLDNLSKDNPKLLVVFSGGNAIGKSSLANRMSNELDALVLENDSIRANLLKFNPALDSSELSPMTWKYSMDLYDRLDDITANGLIVRDGVIDWYYDKILPIFKKHGYELFIVGFDISRKKQIELIKARGDTPTTSVDRLIAILDDHAIHISRFRSLYKPDVLLGDSDVFDHDMVIEKIRARLLDLS